MPRKPAKPKVRAKPQFDADPIDDDEEMPFTMDEDGYMVLRRSEQQQKPKAAKRKGGRDGRRRNH